MYKLIITNTTKKKQKARLLHAFNLSQNNFGLPEGVTLEMKYKDFTYKQVLEYFNVMPAHIKFKSSSNNRHLYFWKIDRMGRHDPYEPQRSIDGSPRQKYKGEKFKLGKNVIYEGDLFQNFFTDKWNPKKWNRQGHET